MPPRRRCGRQNEKHKQAKSKRNQKAPPRTAQARYSLPAKTNKTSFVRQKRKKRQPQHNQITFEAAAAICGTSNILYGRVLPTIISQPDTLLPWLPSPSFVDRVFRASSTAGGGIAVVPPRKDARPRYAVMYHALFVFFDRGTNSHINTGINSNLKPNP